MARPVYLHITFSTPAPALLQVSPLQLAHLSSACKCDSARAFQLGAPQGDSARARFGSAKDYLLAGAFVSAPSVIPAIAHSYGAG